MTSTKRLPRRRMRAVLIPITLLTALLAFTLGWLWSLGPSHLDVQPYSAPEPSATSWEGVFATNPVVDWFPLETGQVLMDKRQLLNPSHPAIDDYEEDGKPLGVFAHLIRHPRHGDLLIDTGLDSSYQQDSLGSSHGPGRWFAALNGVRFVQRPGQDIATVLQRLQANPTQIWLTHIHIDHTSGLPDLDPSIPLFVGPDEPGDWGHHFDPGHLNDQHELHSLIAASGVDLPPLGRAYDILGDGSLWAVNTPGHTRGHLSFVVHATTGPVLLIGDASHFRWAYEHRVGPNSAEPDGRQRGQQSLDKIHAFAELFPDLTLFWGHEAPAVTQVTSVGEYRPR